MVDRSLEGNLQASLFDEKLRMPRRGPKDMVARVWLVPAPGANSHRGLSVLVLLIAVVAIWRTLLRRGRVGVSQARFELGGARF